MMGAAYRQDVDDIRNSPSIKLFNLLKKKNNIIKIYDPVIKDLKKNKHLTQDLPNFRNYDVVIFSVPHRKFKKISFFKLPKKPYYFDINMVLKDKIKKFLKRNNYKIKILGDD
jgi:UDP-N-acetyl-D-mannosaminuronate dehydrogenase